LCGFSHKNIRGAGYTGQFLQQWVKSHISDFFWDNNWLFLQILSCLFSYWVVNFINLLNNVIFTSSMVIKGSAIWKYVPNINLYWTRLPEVKQKKTTQTMNGKLIFVVVLLVTLMAAMVESGCCDACVKDCFCDCSKTKMMQWNVYYKYLERTLQIKLNLKLLQNLDVFYRFLLKFVGRCASRVRVNFLHIAN
jgi:hypothetical protein